MVWLFCANGTATRLPLIFPALAKLPSHLDRSRSALSVEMSYSAPRCAYSLTYPRSIWNRSGALPPATWVASLVKKSANGAYCVLTLIFGCRCWKRSTAAWVAFARDASPHQANERLTWPPLLEPEPEPDPQALAASATPTATAVNRNQRSAPRRPNDVLMWTCPPGFGTRLKRNAGGSSAHDGGC